MGNRIFLSHNYYDKPVVEPIAMKLAEIFGRNEVFYDSWSISPGEGIIDQMSRGLEAPEFVFFFVSERSLASGMVKLEWQNALYSAAKGNTRVVPIRVDDSDMPAVLRQILFIDMFTIGVDAAISQIVGVIQGGVSFAPEHREFSNLSNSRILLADGIIEITIEASHLMEPNPNFAFPVVNEQHQVGWWIKGHPAIHSEFRKKAFEMSGGGVASAVIMRPVVGSLAPRHPLTFQFRQLTESGLNIIGVLHDQGGNIWKPVPPKSNLVNS